MKSPDRMFRVLVLGGIALAATSAELQACGGSVATNASDGGAPDTSTDTNFPVEGPAFIDSGYVDTSFPQETGQQIDAFPTEGPAMLLDSGTTPESSTDSGSAFDGFPQETAQAADP
jgi:hypothetical protein